jgi:hypothetical protein
MQDQGADILKLITPNESPAITAALIMLVLSLAILAVFGLYVWRQAHQTQRVTRRPLDAATQPVVTQPVVTQPIVRQPIVKQPIARQPISVRQAGRPATADRATVGRPATAARRPARGTARVLAH